MARITFDKIADLLTTLGFHRSDEASHVRFERAPARAVIAFPIVRVKEGLTQADIASTRRHLDEQGLLSHQEFDRVIAAAESARESQ